MTQGMCDLKSSAKLLETVILQHETSSDVLQAIEI